MKLTQLFKEKKSLLSFEVFPPKTGDTYDSVSTAVEEIALLRPDFMSVTYGAGGGNSNFAASIATDILEKYGVTPLAHFTCVGSTKENVSEHLRVFREKKIENIMALRGDLPKGAEYASREYAHASDLISYIKTQGDFCIGGACYPEGHPEAESLTQDIKNIKIKVEAGCDFLTTQMFFDNNVLYNYIYKLREAGINVPVVAGIMPVTNAKSIKRICSLSGLLLPARFRMIVDRFGSDPDAMKQAGIAYATEQIIDLYANGIKAVHVYTMNKPDVAAKIQDNLSAII